MDIDMKICLVFYMYGQNLVICRLKLLWYLVYIDFVQFNKLEIYTLLS
jgi:hypothetical protein